MPPSGLDATPVEALSGATPTPYSSPTTTIAGGLMRAVHQIGWAVLGSAIVVAAASTHGASAASGAKLKHAANVTACLGQGFFGDSLSVILPPNTTEAAAKKIEPHYRPTGTARLIVAGKTFHIRREGPAFISTDSSGPRGGPQRTTASDISWAFKNITVTNKYLRQISGKRATIQYSSAATGKRAVKTHVYGNDSCGAG
jgi:hypothetical protein